MQPKGTGSQRQDFSKTSSGISPAVRAGKNGAGVSLNNVINDVFEPQVGSHWYSGIRNLVPGQSTSKYALSRRRVSMLPPGVEEPKVWIKDSGPVKIEPKVWLANQRSVFSFFSNHILPRKAVLTFGQDVYQVAAYQCAARKSL